MKLSRDNLIIFAIIATLALLAGLTVLMFDRRASNIDAAIRKEIEQRYGRPGDEVEVSYAYVVLEDKLSEVKLQVTITSTWEGGQSSTYSVWEWDLRKIEHPGWVVEKQKNIYDSELMR